MNRDQETEAAQKAAFSEWTLDGKTSNAEVERLASGKNVAWKPICVAAALAAAVLIGWPMAKDMTVDRMTAEFLKAAPNGQTLATIAKPMLRTKIDQLALADQISLVTRVLFLPDRPTPPEN